MSKNPMAWEGGLNPRLADFPKAQGCMLPMGLTSENVTEMFGLTRQGQDEFAVSGVLLRLMDQGSLCLIAPAVSASTIGKPASYMNSDLRNST